MVLSMDDDGDGVNIDGACVVSLEKKCGIKVCGILLAIGCADGVFA